MEETIDVRKSAAYDGDVHAVECERLILKICDGQCVIRAVVEAGSIK